MKFTLAIVVVLVGAFVATTHAFPKNGISIAPSADRDMTPQGIAGIKDCGAGAATFIDVRLDGCTTTPCTLTRGSPVTLNIDFRSRDQHWDLTVRSALRKENELQTLVDNYRIPDSTVNPGELYSFTFPFTVPSAFTGKSQLRLVLFQNFVHEVCLVLDVNVV